MATAVHTNFAVSALSSRASAGKKFLRFCTVTLLALGVSAPVIHFNADFFLKIDQLAVPVIALVYLLLMLMGQAKPIGVNSLVVPGVAFCVCILISIFYGSQVIGHPLLLRDFFEIPKAILPILFFTIALEADCSEETLKVYAAVMVPVVLFICLYAIGQWLNLGYAYALQPFYTGGQHDDGALAHYRRVYSTLSNPNILGMGMTWFIGAFTLASILKIGNRFVNVVLLLACLVTETMTGSRYGLINTGIIILLICFLPAPTRKSQKRIRFIILAAVPVLAASIFVVATTNRATLERVQNLRDPLKADSLRARLDGLWLDAIDQFLRSPVLGQGPAKIIFSDIYTDSEYLDILKQFGIVGTISYLFYFLVPLVLVWRGLRKVPSIGEELLTRSPATYWALCVSFMMIVTALGMNVGMSTYLNPSMQCFLWMWMGIGASCAARIQSIPAKKRDAAFLALDRPIAGAADLVSRNV